ncbi:glycosyltransferase [Bacteroidota bacterium]
MSFAKAYLDKVSLDPGFNIQDPNPNLSLVIAIPASNESGLIKTLKCLRDCTPPQGAVEVIIALNSCESSSDELIKQNQLSEKEIYDFNRIHSDRNFLILSTNKTGIRKKEAGAGFARKLAMDHALSRFDKINKKDGIIISLDADTLCESGYLSEVEKHFHNNQRSEACSIYFEHPLEGREFSASVYNGITQYELHLRYYIEGLRYAGHPHAFHTVGSAFAIRAGTYASQGGMNKRTAGEDFYFLQKIIPLGNYSELNSTCLLPSPRPSARVSFGTGPIINQFLSGEIEDLDSYDPRAFYDLRQYISSIPTLYSSDEKETRIIFSSWPESIQTNLGTEFFERLEEIRNNSSKTESFQKRFFRWFNMFRTLKYINFVHREFYPRIPVRIAAKDFVEKTVPGMDSNLETRDLLFLFRTKQREGSWMS